MIVLIPVGEGDHVDLYDIYELRGDENVWLGSRRTEALALDEWDRYRGLLVRDD